MDVIRLARTTSTQDVARTLPVGSAVVTDHQTAGRGRRGRPWQAAPGTALLVSFVLPPHALASLAAGVAAAEACGPDIRLKWPNDLLLDGRKLGGILVEMAGERAIVGIGINLDDGPPGAARLGADRDALLERLIETLAGWFAASPAKVLAAWRERSDTLGRHVRVEVGGEVIEGIAGDVAADGALVVAGRPVHAGEVSYLRAIEPSPPARAAARPTAPAEPQPRGRRRASPRR